MKIKKKSGLNSMFSEKKGLVGLSLTLWVTLDLINVKVLKDTHQLRSSNQLTNKITKITAISISQHKQEITDLYSQKLQVFNKLDIYHSCMNNFFKKITLKLNIHQKHIGNRNFREKLLEIKIYICKNQKFCGWVKYQFDARKRELVIWDILPLKLFNI